MNNYVEENKKIWDEHFHNVSLDIPNEEVVRFLARCRKLYPAGKMLDWGCATGRHTVLGCKWGFQLVAADYVKHCVEITKEKVEKECASIPHEVSYIVNQDIDISEIEDSELDFIVVFGVIFYNTAQKQQQMLKNMYRMLKKGGRVFCDFRTQRDSIYMNRREDMSEEEMLSLSNGAKLYILSLEEIKEMCTSAGFAVESIELNEFTQNNQEIRNSWWHVTLLKE